MLYDVVSVIKHLLTKKLYSYLEMSQVKSLYADTDSVVFSSKTGQYKPRLSNYLGDLTNEVPKIQIHAFVAGGPKDNGHELEHPDKDGNKLKCEINGITLNWKNLMNVNLYVLKTLVASCANTLHVTYYVALV